MLVFQLFPPRHCHNGPSNPHTTSGRFYAACPSCAKLCYPSLGPALQPVVRVWGVGGNLTQAFHIACEKPTVLLSLPLYRLLLFKITTSFKSTEVPLALRLCSWGLICLLVMLKRLFKCKFKKEKTCLGVGKKKSEILSLQCIKKKKRRINCHTCLSKTKWWSNHAVWCAKGRTAALPSASDLTTF